MRQITCFLGAAWTMLMAIGVAGAAPAKPQTLPAERALDMDYGPFLSMSVMRKVAAPSMESKPKKGEAKKPAVPEAVALKGIAIKLYDDKGRQRAAVCFDTDRLCLAEGWTGGFIETADTMLTNHKGIGYTTIDGTEAFRQDGIGWGGGEKADDFSDPRPDGLGPLPPERGRYRGLYLHGNQVVLSYQVAGSDVLELPGYEPGPDGSAVFTRTFRIERSPGPLALAVCELAGSSQQGLPDADGITWHGDTSATFRCPVPRPKGCGISLC